MSPASIWTIGHSTLTQPELIAELKAYGIATLIDVRSFPRSRKNPQSNLEELERALPETGIRYIWMGEKLGGFRKHGYLAHTQTEQFAEGLVELEQVAADSPTAFMCAEKVFFRCHRRHIADALVRRGWRVIHIYDPKRSQVHKLRDEGPELPFDAPKG